MRIYLIHIYTGWNRSFDSIEEAQRFTKEHRFTRFQMYSYVVIEGLGRWSEVADQLPTGPEDPAMGPTSLQPPF